MHKNLTIKCPNGDTLMLYEVPLDAGGFTKSNHAIGFDSKTWRGERDSNNICYISMGLGAARKLEILGPFSPASKSISQDFIVQSYWVNLIGHEPDHTYKLYTEQNATTTSMDESFISFMLYWCQKAFPDATNPLGDYMDYVTLANTSNTFTIRHGKWQEAQMLVMPQRFIVLLQKF